MNAKSTTVARRLAEAREMIADAGADIAGPPGTFCQYAPASSVYKLIDAMTKLTDVVALLAEDVERGKRET